MEGETDQVMKPDEVVLDVPNNTNHRIEFIKQQSRHVILMLCQQSKKAQGLPDSTVEPTRSLLPRLELFLRWLETDVEMTPELKKGSQIDGMLKLLFNDARFQFESSTRARASTLFQKWEEQSWGQGEVDEESSEEDTTALSGDEAPMSSNKRRKSSAMKLSLIHI